MGKLPTCYGIVSLKCSATSWQQVVVMEFGKWHDTTDTTDFCPRQLVTDLLLTCYMEVANLLLACCGGNWCNVFWSSGCAAHWSLAVIEWNQTCACISYRLPCMYSVSLTHVRPWSVWAGVSGSLGYTHCVLDKHKLSIIIIIIIIIIILHVCVCVLHRVKSLWGWQRRMFTSMFTDHLKLLLCLYDRLSSAAWWTTVCWK